MYEIIILIAILFLSYLLRDNRLYCILSSIFYTIVCISELTLVENIFETNVVIFCIIVNIIICSNMLKINKLDDE